MNMSTTCENATEIEQSEQMEGVHDAAVQAKHSAAEKIGEISESAQETAHDAKESGKSTLESMGAKISETFEGAKEAVMGKAEEAKKGNNEGTP